MVKTKILDSREKIKNFLAKLAKQGAFVFNIETVGLDPFAVKLLGMSFSFTGGEAYYLNNQKFSVASLSELRKIFEDKKIKKYGHDMKYALEVLDRNGTGLAGVAFDTMIAAYLLNPGARAYGLDSLVNARLKEKISPIEKLIGEGRKKISLEDAPEEDLAKYSGDRAESIWRLVHELELELEEKGLIKLFNEMEMPLLPVLAEMETDGVKIDAEFLKKYSARIKKDLEKISEKIFKAAGTRFNIDSPIQMREVLFEKLKISTAGIGRGKTGISTAAGELVKLKGKSPIIGLIMEYRELAKLRSTYFEALPKLVNHKTGRIHTSFNQTITSTGRLSSSNPNLQNIPTRSDFGKIVRQGFIAPKGYKILAADYAHIELRIVASLADDQTMIKAFRAGADIHRETASQIWGIPLLKVTPKIRQAAKTINFGVTYGMGARGLAEGAGITFDEAKDFITKYFTVYEGLRNFLDETREKARDFGYVETLFGRRRYLPEIYSPVPMVRAEAERMAINMPVQGTAADIMKLAMIRVGGGLKKISHDSKMILQVHDELVFEVPEKDLRKVSEFVKKTMEGVVKIKVPIIAEVEVGDSWGEMEKYKI